MPKVKAEDAPDEVTEAVEPAEAIESAEAEPAEPPAEAEPEAELSPDRHEVFEATRPDGTVVIIDRNIDTGEQTVTEKK